MSTAEKILVAVVAAIVAIVLLGAFATHRECKQAGGTPVRGLFGIECLKECRK